MKAEAESLLDDFIKKSLGNQYVIPVYQRNYTWNKNKHVKQILSDVKALLKNDKDSHFLGTIVYAVKDGHEITEREIVDGQQRLTTVFLMLYALKNIALEISKPDEAGRITEEYLENKYVNDKYKLRTLIQTEIVRFSLYLLESIIFFILYFVLDKFLLFLIFSIIMLVVTFVYYFSLYCLYKEACGVDRSGTIEINKEGITNVEYC